MRHILKICFFLSVLILHPLNTTGVAHAAPALSSAKNIGEWGETSLVIAKGKNNNGGDFNFKMGVHFQLNDEWKIYWRYPGEAGLPPKFNFSGSENITIGTQYWPLPEKLDFLGIQSNGYQGDITFPFTFRPSDNIRESHLKLQLDFLACYKLCIPATSTHDLAIPASIMQKGGNINMSENADNLRLINKFINKSPIKIADNAPPPLSISHVEHIGTKDNIHSYRLMINDKDILDDIEIFIEPAINSHSLINEGKILSKDGKNVLITFDIQEYSDTNDEKRSEFITLTVASDARNIAFEQRLPIFKNPLNIASSDYDKTPISNNNFDDNIGMSTPSILSFDLPFYFGQSPFATWLTVIVISLMGGMILNFMPCVLPALGLKIFSITKASTNPHMGGAYLRKSFLATALGIIITFILLAAILLTLQSFGAVIGWGSQFQQPVFLAVLLFILIFFAGNLLGLFNLILPNSIATTFNNKTTNNHHSLYKDFLLGVFITILATPCTAPFLGTAIGVALLLNGLGTIVIFFFLGIGMAFPYLTIALFPNFANFIPKPGRWMNYLKIFLSGLLLLTALWLGFLLQNTHSVGLSLFVAGLASLSVFYLYMREKMDGLFKSKIYIIPLCLFITAIFLSLGQAPSPPAKQSTANQSASEASTNNDWRRFDENLIPPLLEQGRVIFVDVTADWCITCQFNKHNILLSGQAVQLFNDWDVVLMQADWTRYDEDITHYLHKHQRAGIPLYVVYGPKAKQGIILSEILTFQEINRAILKAKG